MLQAVNNSPLAAIWVEPSAANDQSESTKAQLIAGIAGAMSAFSPPFAGLAAFSIAFAGGVFSRSVYDKAAGLPQSSGFNSAKQNPDCTYSVRLNLLRLVKIPNEMYKQKQNATSSF